MHLLVKDIAEITIGYQIRESLQLGPEGSHLVVQTKDIDNDAGHELVPAYLDHITPARNPGPYSVKNGDVIVLSRGRRHAATLVEGLPDAPPAIALYYFFILRIRHLSVNPAYLAWAINEDEAQSYMEGIATGTGIPFISKQAFSELELPIPALDRQERIAALHRLSVQERRLRRLLERERFELVRSACRSLREESL